MFTLIVVGIFVLIVAIIIYFEYKNEKEYQADRHKRTEDRKKIKPPYHPKEKIQKPFIEKNEKATKRRAATPGAKEKTLPQEKNKTTNDTYKLKNVVEPRKVPSAQEIREAEEKEKLKAKRVEEQRLQEQRLQEQRLKEQKLQEQKLQEQKPEPEVTKKVDLPECNYPKFDHSRLLEMGLSQNEVEEFVAELIPQIEAQIPLIKEAMDISDFHNMERLTHSIKGSSTTVGTGGISDLLVEFNTYLKTGKELAVVEAYFKHLKHYSQELKEQYT